MSTLQLLITGAAGRMGKEVTALVQKGNDFKIVAAVDRPGKSEAGEMPSPEAGEVQMVIDFSSPELLRQTLKWCQRAKTPIVSGTTGLNAEDMALLKQVASEVPVLWAPNMSLGVALMTEMLKVFASVSAQFDFQIEEFHHKHKVDRPSGTAIHIQNKLSEVVKRELPEPLSVRGGGIFGIHKVSAMSEEEIINIEHTALNRQVFARGALAAAKWLYGRGPGLYSMRDVLSLSQ